VWRLVEGLVSPGKSCVTKALKGAWHLVAGGARQAV